METVEATPTPRFVPNPCCAGGWWLRAEGPPADEEAQPETD